MEIILSAENLHKTYTLPHADVTVLRGASLDVRAGESAAVIGISGAGKSTLLHVLGGLDCPEAGIVRVGGEDLYGLRPRRRSRMQANQIGFVFQSYHLLPEMDLIENVMLPALALPVPLRPEGDMRERARSLLDSVGLGERERHTPLELSGGEQQRAALARALMNAPRLVLADEPTGNLDSETGSQVLELLFELTCSGGHALIMVTHNQSVAARCDRVLRLTDGLLVEQEVAESAGS